MTHLKGSCKPVLQISIDNVSQYRSLTDFEGESRTLSGIEVSMVSFKGSLAISFLAATFGHCLFTRVQDTANIKVWEEKWNQTRIKQNKSYPRVTKMDLRVFSFKFVLQSLKLQEEEKLTPR